MTECISKVKEHSSPRVTSANTMPTSVKHSRVVLIVRLICHDEIVYKEIIFCETSLSVNVNSTFLLKITRLAQNIPQATINSSTKKRLVWYTAVFSFVTERSSPLYYLWRGALRDVSKN